MHSRSRRSTVAPTVSTHIIGVSPPNRGITSTGTTAVIQGCYTFLTSDDAASRRREKYRETADDWLSDASTARANVSASMSE